ncbi:MAG: PKD domain-containing protein [Dehalococcoidia bacterium]
MATLQVWFAPYPQGTGPGVQIAFGHPDYEDLFNGAGQWDVARGQVDVFQLYWEWVTKVSPAEVASAVQFLEGSGIAIAVEVPALQWQTAGPVCGVIGEGWVEDHVAITLEVLDRIDAAGVAVDYLTMQEPYTSASPTTAAPYPAQCNWSMAQIAAHVADYVAAVHAEYPAVQFGDVESDHASPAELAAWAAAYEAAVGVPLAYLHLDVDWFFRSDWAERAFELEQLMSTTATPFGMIYNGLHTDPSSGAWIANALAHAAQYEGQAGGTPQHVNFQSWHRYPDQLFPDTDPNAMTSIVNQYASLRTDMTLSLGASSGGSRTASVTATAGGGPLAGVPADVRYTPADGPGVEATYTIEGVIPQFDSNPAEDRGHAVIGFRVNQECNCGFSDSYFSFYGGSFRQASTLAGLDSAAELIPNPDFSSGAAPWITDGEAAFVAGTTSESPHLRVDAPSAEPAMTNSGQTRSGTNNSPLTPGWYFRATFDAKVDPRSVGSGYFTVIFVKWDWSREIDRFRVPIEPPWFTESEFTDGSGSAQVLLDDLPPARLLAEASTAGSSGRLPGFSPRQTAGALEPQLTSTVPATIVEGSAPQELRLLGTGFNWNSVVAWDGVPRATTVVSASELRITLTSADLLAAGNHTIAVETPAPGGGVDSTTFDVAPRVITISGPPTVDEGATYTLNLSAAYPGSEDIERWRINWGDGQETNVVGNPSSATHTYTDGPAGRTITAEVRDDGQDFEAAAPVTVSVLNVAPSITVAGPASVDEGQDYALTFSRTDPGNDAVQSWSVDWGDGTAVSVLPANATGASHTYADGPAGPSIHVSVTDDDGTHLAAPKAITVSNVAPAVTINGPSTVVTGATYTLSLSVTDPGADTVSSWQISWGDGPPETVTGNPGSVTHVYASAPGTQQVSATAIDEDGAHTSNQLTVNVYNVAPPLTIDGPATVDEGATYTLSLDSGAPFVASWTIDWGDGTGPEVISGDPASATHVYADGPETHAITATATDGADTWPSNSVNVSVNDVAPTIAVAGSGSVDEGSAYTVNFSATDPGADPVTGWSVDWGDGSSPSLLPAAAVSAQHGYPHGPEVHNIVVTVVQGADSFASDSHAVSVADVAPTVSASGPGSTAEGDTYTLSLTATDPGSDPLTSWRIDWGDGETDTVSGNPSAATHIYADGPADVVISASAFQGDDEFPATAINVSVTNTPPSITLDGPASLREQHPYSLAVSLVDPGDDTVEGWSVDWGDGSPVDSLPAEASAAEHVYAVGAVTRTITVTVTDEDGLWVATKQVDVLGPPTLSVGGPSSVDEGAPYQLTLAPPPADITGWIIDWGDGSPHTVIPAEAPTAQHIYADGPASHTIIVEGTDSYASWPSNTVSVTVNDVAPALVATGPSSAVVSQPYVLTLGWTDPGADSVTAWTIDWGDGSAPQEVSGLVTSTTHAYASAGGRTVRATATDGVDSWLATPLNVQVGLAALGRHQLSALGTGNEMLLVGRNSGGQLWARETSAGDFGPWTLLGGGAASRPEAVRSGTSDFVFFRNSSNGLGYVTRTDGGTWTPGNLGGTFAGDPAAAVDADGDIIVTVRNAGSQLWVRRFTAGAWLPWSRIDGALAGSLHMASYGADLYLFGLGNQGQTWARRWASDTNSWQQWEPLGGTVLPGISAAETPAGTLLFVAVNGSGQPWSRERSVSGWGPWTLMTGTIATPPALASATNRVVLGAINASRNLWTRSHDGATWGAWVFGSGVLASDAEAAAAGTNVWMFSMATGGKPWFRRWDGASWGPWTSLGGTLAID